MRSVGDCDHCGKPEHRHMEIMGTGKVCPIQGNTYSSGMSDKIVRMKALLRLASDALKPWNIALREQIDLELRR